MKKFGNIKIFVYLLFLAVVSSPIYAQQADTENRIAPRVSLFAGYNYWEPHGSANGIRLRSLNSGAVVSASVFYNAYVGAEIAADFHSQTYNDGMYGFAAGPVIRLPFRDLTPFGHVLIGASNITAPNAPTLGGASYQVNPASWGLSIIPGGGLDFQIPGFGNHLGARIIELDYQALRGFNNPVVGDPNKFNFSATRVSTGLLFNWGNVVPLLPLRYTCAISHSSSYAGEPVTITGTVTGLDQRQKATYHWSTNGGIIHGDTENASLDTSTIKPGVYRVAGTVSQGRGNGHSATCSLRFRISATTRSK